METILVLGGTDFADFARDAAATGVWGGSAAA